MPKHNLGKNTVIGHVQTEDRLNEIATRCNERGLKFIIGLEPDKPEDISDIERRLNPSSPHFAIHIGRNEPCPCGSGKKYKKCCGK
jgi:SWIM/SEC-C metal-binding protein